VQRRRQLISSKEEMVHNIVTPESFEMHYGSEILVARLTSKGTKCSSRGMYVSLTACKEGFLA
jgi:hypothetical protein